MTYYKRGSNVTVGLYQAGSKGTLIGSSAGTLYKGNGTAVRQIGDSHTRYKRSSSKKTLQGSQVTRTLYYRNTSGEYTEIGYDVYQAGTSSIYEAVEGATYYDAGGYVYPRGDSVTGVYYAGNEVTLQGAEYTSTVFLSGGSETVTLQGEAYPDKVYGAGVSYTTDDILNPARITTKEVTALTT